MILEETIQKLLDLKLGTMAQALREIVEQSPGNQLSFEEKIWLIVDREWTERQNRRLARRRRDAKLRAPACLEDVSCARAGASTRPPFDRLERASGYEPITT